jgi:hypothetical protein
MRSAELVDPVRDLGSGVIEAEEQALVEKLVAHAPVETLAEAILHRLSWRNESKRDVTAAGDYAAMACELAPLHFHGSSSGV